MNYHSGVSDVLMKATVDTLPNQECRRKWGRFSFIASENICAGGIGADQCSDDIGGPLDVQVEGDCPSAHAQIGVVSSGPVIKDFLANTQEFRTT